MLDGTMHADVAAGTYAEVLADVLVSLILQYGTIHHRQQCQSLLDSIWFLFREYDSIWFLFDRLQLHTE
jgi:hypothetical protein